MEELIYIVLLILSLYVGLGVIYSFFFAFISIFYKDSKYPDAENQARVAVFIPGYKEDSIIYHVANDALNQNYPKDKYDVIVIADSFSEDTLSKLRTLPIKLMEVSFEKSTKAKSLNQVMGQLGDAYDIALVLDADNLMASDVLQKVNNAYSSGMLAMQAHRTAKNLDTPFARLDAMSEEINNSIFRRGHWYLGVSSALIGSGMAFDYKMYRDLMSGIDVVSGFDKEVEIQLLKRGIRVAFLNDAIVFDEKVQSAEIFEKQRTRWLAAQVNFAIKYFFSGLVVVFTKARFGLFDKALQFALLPRALTLAALLILIAVSFVLSQDAMLALNIRFLLLFVAAMLLAIPKQFYNFQMFKSFVLLPKAIFNMVLSLLKMKKAKDTFLHTPHSHVEPNKEV